MKEGEAGAGQVASVQTSSPSPRGRPCLLLLLLGDTLCSSPLPLRGASPIIPDLLHVRCWKPHF